MLGPSQKKKAFQNCAFMYFLFLFFFHICIYKYRIANQLFSLPSLWIIWYSYNIFLYNYTENHQSVFPPFPFFFLRFFFFCTEYKIVLSLQNKANFCTHYFIYAEGVDRPLNCVHFSFL